MKRSTLSRINSTLVVVVGGMALGHLLLPYSPGRGPLVRVAFYLAMALLGALRGLRDATVRGVPGRARLVRGIGAAIAAVVLAWLAYIVVHG